MIELRPVIFVIGILLTVLAIAMVIPAIVDIAVGHPDWQVFLVAAFVTLFVGVSMMLTTRASLRRFSIRQAFVMTNLAWLVIVIFGALPFLFSELELNPVDAFFEAMSGVTTTGSTVIVGRWSFSRIERLEMPPRVLRTATVCLARPYWPRMSRSTAAWKSASGPWCTR